MKIKIRDEFFYLVWNHRQPTKKDVGGTTLYVKDTNKKVCDVIKLNLNHKDTFSKELGRKYSLERFTRKFENKSIRKEIWSQYLKR